MWSVTFTNVMGATRTSVHNTHTEAIAKAREAQGWGATSLSIVWFGVSREAAPLEW